MGGLGAAFVLTLIGVRALDVLPHDEVGGLLDDGMLLPSIACDAEQLPFRSDSFDLVSVAFGLRNMTHKDAALAEMQRVLKPGGRLKMLTTRSY